MAIDRSARSVAMFRASAVGVLRRVFDTRQGPLRFVLLTTLLSMAVVMVVLAPIAWVLFGVLDVPIEQPGIDSPVFTLIAAPVVENILFIGVIEFLLAFDLRTRTVVLAIACLSALAHGLAAELRAVAGFVMFATMAYTYLLWYQSRFLKRYAMTVMQHVLFNMPATLWMLLDSG